MHIRLFSIYFRPQHTLLRYYYVSSCSFPSSDISVLVLVFQMARQFWQFTARPRRAMFAWWKPPPRLLLFSETLKCLSKVEKVKLLPWKVNANEHVKSVYCSLQLMSEFWEKKKGGKSSEIHYDNVCNLPFLLYSFLCRCIHQVRLPIWRFEFAPKLSFENLLNWAMIIEAI